MMNFRRPFSRPKMQAFMLSVVMIGALGAIGGCNRSQEITSEYGRRMGREGAASVNGTSVLARMFREGGAGVRTSSRLGRIVERADVVVWIPDRFAAPTKESRDFFEDWLAEHGESRTLIYVGRDYDAAVQYYQHLVDSSATGASEGTPEQYLEARKKLAKARVAQAAQRAVYERKEDCDWFAIDRGKPSRKVKSLRGPLSDGVDGSRVNIELNTRIQPGSIVDSEDDYRGVPEFETLLKSGKDVLAGRFTREYWSGSQVIVVANGSWLLNLPLVNHQHRRLAGNLISECGDAERVVFLESGPGEPPISRHEPNQHHGLAAFTVWPINCILMHLLALGIVFCFAVFPIFGRPRSLADTGASDFGKHIAAIGELMSRTHDRGYAQQCREVYQQRVADKTKRDVVDEATNPKSKGLVASSTTKQNISSENPSE